MGSDFALARPIAIFLLRGAIERLDQQAAQAVTALKIGADDFEAHFVDACTPEQDVRFDLGAHSHRDFQIGFAADAEIIFFCSHAAPET